MSDLLEAIELETGAHPTASVIWLHGLGADGHDFEAIVPELDLPPVPIRFVFPHAPMQSVTINAGMMMRAWYDVSDAAIRLEDEAGVRASQARLEALIAREQKRGSSGNRILLAGFSQGGAIALHTALRHPESLAGVMALSCYLPIPERLAAEVHIANSNIPIFMAHGTEDPVVPVSRARESRELLERQGYTVDWREYRMPHSVCQEEISDISDWIRRLVAPQGITR